MVLQKKTGLVFWRKGSRVPNMSTAFSLLLRINVICYSISVFIQFSNTSPLQNCPCTCDSNTVDSHQPANSSIDQIDKYIPKWFKKNCTYSTNHAALINLNRALGYLKQFTSDIVTQIQFKYDFNLNESCLPSSTINVTNFHPQNVYEVILKDLSKMATFIYRLKLNNEPDPSPNRAKQHVQKLFDDDNEYHVIDHILHQCQCYLRSLLSDSNVVDKAHKLAEVDFDICRWGCKDYKCLYRELVVVRHLNLIVSSSLKIIYIVETTNRYSL